MTATLCCPEYVCGKFVGRFEGDVGDIVELEWEKGEVSEKPLQKARKENPGMNFLVRQNDSGRRFENLERVYRNSEKDL